MTHPLNAIIETIQKNLILAIQVNQKDNNLDSFYSSFSQVDDEIQTTLFNTVREYETTRPLDRIIFEDGSTHFDYVRHFFNSFSTMDDEA